MKLKLLNCWGYLNNHFSTAEMTARYAHLVDQSLRDAVELIK